MQQKHRSQRAEPTRALCGRKTVSVSCIELIHTLALRFAGVYKHPALSHLLYLAALRFCILSGSLSM
jgi:hypothetical protein